jgi:hypothetical protein
LYFLESSARRAAGICPKDRLVFMTYEHERDNLAKGSSITMLSTKPFFTSSLASELCLSKLSWGAR